MNCMKRIQAKYKRINKIQQKYFSNISVGVIGGGSVGMITSLFLSKCKINSTVFEKNSTLSSKSNKYILI